MPGPAVTPKKPSQRRRSSVTSALNQIPLNHEQASSVQPVEEVKPLTSRPRLKSKGKRDALPAIYSSNGFWDDVKTGRWMLIPSSSFKLMLIPPILYLNHCLLVHYGILGPDTPNIFEHLIFPSNRLPDGRYGKSWWDLAFMANYIIFWSFVRQFMTLKVFRPMAMSLGIKGGKIMRFTEQGYAFFYFGILGSLGVYVMHGLPTWWYKTEHFWLEYPHREMTWELKTYYLMQAAYWLQQTILLAAKIEKPRKDFKELVAHHIVTLWLVGWSYNIYLTYIGVSVFVTMDVSDIFLALAKCVNYVSDFWSVPVFAWFIFVWSYFRHYLNIWILWSVWTQFDLIRPSERSGFDPLNDNWLSWWMKWQIFTPIFLLQLINLFWYFLIWRILVRAVFYRDLKDERSDDEEENEVEEVKEKAE
ncbi:acyl-CoA-dependent ceramide synthase [Cryptococcus gattii Ru294]|uniref:Acyl-CoA-dependent ceramide synthase n=2 Tax=Cryptococcus gattii TaxID=37769 RepID=A0ABR5BRI5_9TREE|nr:Ceramide synthase component, putative; Lag1p [Cryptococcus gattii WM276]KIR51356.1 acyl-CoA-dependent ceramide synthase [Cryptococcus gattii Ru294]KIR78257.1 acyl-CoA-dependent ceramide synthase [Cryptococcus gattii EJB2]KIY33051.1 acyl-CoA-dependent ceramide synthase [Cryptococcus gattii E566]KJE02935.1 acyl-CoA-dependent ceramide synthase [Cryptococcus gattii NT-10]ADV22743.1 Ceramide synthase component, putative; Lag1p [Cryptococcus gattii WM276]